jgi:L-ascorbate metabolism protein UlaG (beta-lactamase superfamily)
MYVKEYNPAAGGLIRLYTVLFASATTATFTPACGHFWLLGITGVTAGYVFTLSGTNLVHNPDGSYSCPSGSTITITSTSNSDLVTVATLDY